VEECDLRRVLDLAVGVEHSSLQGQIRSRDHRPEVVQRDLLQPHERVEAREGFREEIGVTI